LTSLLAATAAGLAVYALARGFTWPSSGESRLHRLAGGHRPTGESQRAAEVKVSPSRPAFWVASVRRLVPPGLISRLLPADAAGAAALEASGREAVDVQLLGFLAGLVGVLGLCLVAIATGHSPSGPALAVTGAASLLGPRLWVRAVVGRYQAAIARELPKAAELLTLGAESGLGLLEAMRLAVGLGDGPVARALAVALAEMDAGRETVAALKAAAERIGGQGATAFVASIVQGIELGTPVARVLRVQADTLRTKHRQALEARIAAISLKVTLVTVLLFVPPLLVLAVLPNLLAFLGRGW
jgi:Flp pilus assembly protein TadB